MRKRARRERERERAWASWRRRGTTASTSSEHDVVDVVLHLLVPRPAALAGGAVWRVAIEIERAITKNASF